MIARQHRRGKQPQPAARFGKSNTFHVNRYTGEISASGPGQVICAAPLAFCVPATMLHAMAFSGSRWYLGLRCAGD